MKTAGRKSTGRIHALSEPSWEELEKEICFPSFKTQSKLLTVYRSTCSENILTDLWVSQVSASFCIPKRVASLRGMETFFESLSVYTTVMRC